MATEIGRIRTKQTASSRAYAVKRTEAIELLKSIRRALDQHANGPNGWGAVGDLGNVCQRLHEIAEFLCQEDRS